MKKKLLPVWVFARIAIKRSFRDKLALFFIFLFPLIFLFIFGGIFGKSNEVSFRVALINESSSEFSKTFAQELSNNKAFKVDKTVTTLDKSNEKMKRGQVDATIILPENFGKVVNGKYPSGEAKIVYTQNSVQAAQTLGAVMDGTFKGVNSMFVKSDTPFTVRLEQSNEKALSPFDYVFSGLLGFSIIGLGIFGPINVFPELKKQGILRRLNTTPLKVWQYFLANVLSQSIIGVLSVAVMMIVALTAFHLKITGNLLELAVFVILGIIMIFGIGLAVGGWAKNERQAAPLGNLISFPMMFLTGAFFPRYLMPEWLQKLSDYIPLTPVIDGIRLILNEGKHLTEIGPQLGLVLVWLVVVYLIAFRVFRWE